MELKTTQGASALGQPPAAAPPRPAPHDADATAPATGATQPPPPVVVIDSGAGASLALRDLWTYRELLYFLTWRDVKVRYKQTLMGAAWVVVQPLAQMLLFTLFFHRFAGVGSGDMPYPLFAYTGLLLWTFFSNAVVNGTNSLVSNTNLITKVYFPRMFIPAAAVGAGLVDLGVASLVLVGLALFYGAAPAPSGLLLLPLFVALTLLLSLAVGLLVSSLTVKYRDLRHALPFVLQFWMFASPVIYPSSVVPERWRSLLLAANPLAGIVENFRAALVGRPVHWPSAAAAAALTLALLILSAHVFRRAEESFADVV